MINNSLGSVPEHRFWSHAQGDARCSFAAARVTSHGVDVVQFLFDGDWLELRSSPAGATSRTAYGHSLRAHGGGLCGLQLSGWSPFARTDARLAIFFVDDRRRKKRKKRIRSSCYDSCGSSVSVVDLVLVMSEKLVFETKMLRRVRSHGPPVQRLQRQ